MVEAASDYLGQRIYLVVGGFHLASKEKPEVELLLEKLRPKIEKVCPTHCTGEEAIELFREGYGQDCIPEERGDQSISDGRIERGGQTIGSK
ncbi:hypothetical protein K9M06_06475 [Candidatus Bipolaricaulota bacterium]|nr:hypothetical protein [Candidatus Bipolaricaulota bacterium]